MMKKTMLLSLVMLLLYGCVLTPGQDTSARIPSTSPTPEFSAQSPMSEATPTPTPEPTPDVPEATQVALIAIESLHTYQSHIFEVMSDKKIYYQQCLSMMLGKYNLRDNEDYYGGIIFEEQTVELTDEEYDTLINLIDTLSGTEETDKDTYMSIAYATGGQIAQALVDGKLYLSFYYIYNPDTDAEFDKRIAKYELIDLAYFLIDTMGGITDSGYEDAGKIYAWETPKSLQEKDETK